MMLGDDSVAVQKRVIQAMTHLYRLVLCDVLKYTGLNQAAGFRTIWRHLNI